MVKIKPFGNANTKELRGCQFILEILKKDLRQSYCADDPEDAKDKLVEAVAVIDLVAQKMFEVLTALERLDREEPRPSEKEHKLAGADPEGPRPLT